jgi:Phage related protein
MFSVANLIERAKARSNIESDYRLCKIIAINQSAFGNYKAGRSLPTDKIIGQLCALSGDDVAVILAQVHEARATDSDVKNMWHLIAKRLAGGASTAILTVLFTIALIAGYAPPAQAGGRDGVQSRAVDCLYIVLINNNHVKESSMRKFSAFMDYDVHPS